MSYLPHEYFVLGGTIGTGTSAEIWQCGVRGTFGATITDAQRSAWLGSTATAMASWFSLTASQTRTDAVMTYVKCNAINALGHYANPSSSFTVSTVATGGTTPTVPGILTVAWTWKTALGRGPGSKGRVYMPVQVGSFIVPGADRITGGSTTTHVTAAKSFLVALGTARGGVTFTPCVASGVGSGVLAPITTIAVGDVVDVQRRRKDALRESYSFGTYP